MGSSIAKQRKALEFYVANGRNVSATARHVQVSRVTVTNWKKKGMPVSVTGGKDWDLYAENQDLREVQRARTNSIQKEGAFIDKARDTLELALSSIHMKIEGGEFEAKAGDLPKLIEMYAKLETRDSDMKAWMNGIMIQIMELAARVMSPEQYAVFGTLLMDLNRDKTEKLQLVEDTHGMPEFPSQASVIEKQGMYQKPQSEPEYATFTESS